MAIYVAFVSMIAMLRIVAMSVVCEGGDDDFGHNSCVLLAEFYILQGRPMHHPWNVFVLNFKHGF